MLFRKCSKMTAPINFKTSDLTPFRSDKLKGKNSSEKDFQSLRNETVDITSRNSKKNHATY